MAKLVEKRGQRTMAQRRWPIHPPLPPSSRTAAIAFYSPLRVQVGRRGRILTLPGGGKMPHAIAGGSFATFGIL